jgi:ABC-type transport system involved in multi-copper enzyme maturation permease subunit
MNWKCFTGLLWKEWRETRLRALLLLLSFLIPNIYLIAKMGLKRAATLPFFTTQFDTATNYIGFVLPFQFYFLITFGLLLIAILGSRMIAPEIENHQIFFLCERPMRRSFIVSAKFLVGAAEVCAAVALSIEITRITFFLLSPLVLKDATLSLAWHSIANLRLFGTTLVYSSTVGILGIAVFSAALFCSVLFNKWWIGEAIGIMTFILLFHFSNWNVFIWFEGSHATRISRLNSGLLHQDFSGFEHLRPSLSLLFVGLALLFYGMTYYWFSRKELKGE